MQVGGCGFWEWYDPPLCPIATELIPMLRDEIIQVKDALDVKESIISAYEAELGMLQQEVIRLKGGAKSVIGHEEECRVKTSIYVERMLKVTCFFVVMACVIKVYFT